MDIRGNSNYSNECSEPGLVFCLPCLLRKNTAAGVRERLNGAVLDTTLFTTALYLPIRVNISYKYDRVKT